MSAPAEPAEPPPLPPDDLLTLEALRSGLETLLKTESWDILTLKVVLLRLEQQLLPQHPPGTLKPFKKAIKAEVDAQMKRMLETPAAEEAAAEEAPAAAEEEAAAPAEEEALVEEEAVDEEAEEEEAVEEEAVVEEAAEDDDEPKIKRRKVADEDEEDDDEEKPRAEGDDDDDEDDDDDDEDEDPDAPQVAGKPISKSEGKVYYRKMIIKGSDELRLGQDVYLDTDGSEPYVARLEEIFVYSFAPNEVYFNARWYYRCNDCTEYARLAGAPADYVVQYESYELVPRLIHS